MVEKMAHMFDEEAKDENEGSGNATPSVVRKRHRKEDPFKPLEKKKKMF